MKVLLKSGQLLPKIIYRDKFSKGMQRSVPLFIIKRGFYIYHLTEKQFFNQKQNIFENFVFERT